MVVIVYKYVGEVEILIENVKFYCLVRIIFDEVGLLYK